MQDFAKAEDVGELKRLWDACFGGPPAYIDFYYENRFRPEETLVWREDGKPVSMMTLMNADIGTKHGFYIYAVATLPAYRGRGLMTRLDGWSKEVMRARGGAFSTLVPAEAALFPLYEKLGYRADFPIWQREIRGAGRNPGHFEPCAFHEFLELRRAFLERVPRALSHPPAELRYIYEELNRFSGEILVCEEHGKRCYAAFNRDEHGLFVREYTGSDPAGAARALLCRYGLKRAVVRSFEPRPGFLRTPFGMGRWLEDDVSSLSGHLGGMGYMALMLD